MASPKSDNDQKTNSDAPKFPTITRAELAGNYFNKHVAFVIKTPSGQEIKRRYTDFEWLRGLLRTLYPGAFIPPIPPKLPVAMWPQGYLLMRKRELQQFLQRLEVIPYLKRDEITVFFLSKHSAFDKVRKQWEKEHPKPSDKWLHENLCKTFPKIHETDTPSDMNKRCSESTQLIESSVRQLEVMVKSGESFVDRSNECCLVLSEFRNAFDDLVRTEYAADAASDLCGECFGAEKRVDISPQIEQWRTYKLEELNHAKLYYLPALRRALNDLRVIREILQQRDQIQGEYNAARQAADLWNDPNQTRQVRSSDLAKKHREIQREEDLRRLKAFVEKLVLGQLNVVFCANQRRWKKSCHLFAEKHVASLEKASGSWKALVNKIEHSQGNQEAVHKAVIEDEDEDETQEKTTVNETRAEEKEKDVNTTAAVAVATRTEQSTEELQDVNENQHVEDDDDEEIERRELEAKEQQEQQRREQEEALKKAEQASKAKMDEMFKDEDEDGNENAPNEFPWDD